MENKEVKFYFIGVLKKCFEPTFDIDFNEYFIVDYEEALKEFYSIVDDSKEVIKEASYDTEYDVKITTNEGNDSFYISAKIFDSNNSISVWIEEIKLK